MGIPLNLIHDYVGAPILLYICFHGLFLTKNKSNIVTRYVAYSSGIFAVAMSFYGFPALFTHDSNILTLTTIFGDIFQYISLIYMAFLAIHLSLSRWPRLVTVMRILALCMTLVYILVSLRENLAHPAHIITSENGVRLEYVSTYAYNIWTSISFSSLLAVGISFLLQIRRAARKSQRYRIGALGLFFTIIGALFTFGPIIGYGISSSPLALVTALVLLSLALMLTIAAITSRRESKA